MTGDHSLALVATGSSVFEGAAGFGVAAGVESVIAFLGISSAGWESDREIFGEQDGRRRRSFGQD